MKETELTARYQNTEEILTGYSYNGEQIVAARRPGRPRKIRNKSWYPQDKKIEACTLYAVYGDIEEVSKISNIPQNILRTWKQEPWWIEILKQIYIEQNEGLAAKLTNILDKTLSALDERLTNGDYVLTRDGDLKRKPVDTKVLTSLFDNLAVQRRLTRGEPTSISASIGVEDRLKQMQDAFEKFSKAKEIVQEKDTNA